MTMTSQSDLSGTDPRNASLGQPPPADAIFWSPREVWVRGLAAEQWYDYTGRIIAN